MLFKDTIKELKKELKEVKRENRELKGSRQTPQNQHQNRLGLIRVSKKK